MSARYNEVHSVGVQALRVGFLGVLLFICFLISTLAVESLVQGDDSSRACRYFAGMVLGGGAQACMEGVSSPSCGGCPVSQGKIILLVSIPLGVLYAFGVRILHLTTPLQAASTALAAWLFLALSSIGLTGYLFTLQHIRHWGLPYLCQFFVPVFAAWASLKVFKGGLS